MNYNYALKSISLLSLVILFFGRPGHAVGLSAVSFSASLRKDAAAIPDAWEAHELKLSAIELFLM